MNDNELSSFFGQKLRQLRENQNLNQEDIGSWFNMGKSTVSQWESGRIPHASILVELANRLGVSIDYLLGREAPTSTSKPIEISLEEIELLNQIKKASADKQKAIELILNIEEKTNSIASGK